MILGAWNHYGQRSIFLFCERQRGTSVGVVSVVSVCVNFFDRTFGLLSGSLQKYNYDLMTTHDGLELTFATYGNVLVSD